MSARRRSSADGLKKQRHDVMNRQEIRKYKYMNGPSKKKLDENEQQVFVNCKLVNFWCFFSGKRIRVWFSVVMETKKNDANNSVAILKWICQANPGEFVVGLLLITTITFESFLCCCLLFVVVVSKT